MPDASHGVLSPITMSGTASASTACLGMDVSHRDDEHGEDTMDNTTARRRIDWVATVPTKDLATHVVALERNVAPVVVDPDPIAAMHARAALRELLADSGLEVRR